MQIERDEQLRSFQGFTNRYPSPYQASYSTNPLYYSQNIGREFPSNPVFTRLASAKPSTLTRNPGRLSFAGCDCCAVLRTCLIKKPLQRRKPKVVSKL